MDDHFKPPSTTWHPTLGDLAELKAREARNKGIWCSAIRSLIKETRGSHGESMTPRVKWELTEFDRAWLKKRWIVAE